MKHIWKQKAKCKSCDGTGIRSGLVKNKKVGIVCSDCKGTGWREIVEEWEDFEGKVKRKDVERVVEANLGILMDEDPECGGMLYNDWLEKGSFPPKSENRKYSCPCWWYQAVDSKLKPNWEECPYGIRFDKCSNFKKKYICWRKWDREFGEKI